MPALFYFLFMQAQIAGNILRRLFSKNIKFYSPINPVTYIAIHTPDARNEKTVAKYGKNLKDPSSPKLMSASTNATNATNIDETPALPKYMLPAPLC